MTLRRLKKEAALVGFILWMGEQQLTARCLVAARSVEIYVWDS